MRHALAVALGISIGTLFTGTAWADPPDRARNDTGSLHPGHQGHLSSGQTYPGEPATQFHNALDAGEETYPTGPGGWAEQQSEGANAQRSSGGS
jgi:hypothetical protein